MCSLAQLYKDGPQPPEAVLYYMHHMCLQLPYIGPIKVLLEPAAFKSPDVAVSILMKLRRPYICIRKSRALSQIGHHNV